ncbi:MAG: hypothetical protein ACK4ND_08520 [Cytophagaceae bacterium]
MTIRRKRIYIASITLLLLFYGNIAGCQEYPTIPKQLSMLEEGKEHVNAMMEDSMITIPAGKHYQKNLVHDAFFGRHYRHLWAEPVTMPVLDLDNLGDSLYVKKRGGGQQTLNLRLRGKDKREYVIRTVDKDQANVLPEKFRTGLAKHFFRDQTSAMNPYAALVVPPLAEAAGIYHVKPKLYYVPYDERFGEYAELIEGRVVTVEEFPNKHWAGDPLFGPADKLKNTTKFLDKRFSSQDVSVDERMFARCRLFDLLIGDWDRHRNQWRWIEVKEDGKRHYKPVPRDRDVVFYRFNDGLLTYIASRWFIMPKLHTFEHYYGSIENMLLNSKYTDNLLLMSLTEDDWLEIADSLQTAMSDEAIEHAIKTWPEEIYKLEGRQTIEKLKSRRDLLQEAAIEFYRQLNRNVVLIGTDEEERFVVERINNKQTSVTITRKDNNEEIFHRVFDNRYTKSICLHGLGGDDHFLVKGSVNRGPFINIYGGYGYDTIIDRSKVVSWRKHVSIFDTPEGNYVELGKRTKDRRTDDPSILDIDREGWNTPPKEDDEDNEIDEPLVDKK